MNLNEDNYEAYLLDYLEDRLNADQKRQVDVFLEQHPAIESEFRMLRDEWDKTKLPTPCNEEYPDKDALIRIASTEKSPNTERQEISAKIKVRNPSCRTVSRKKPHIRLYRYTIPSLALAACLLLFFLSRPFSGPKEAIQKTGHLAENPIPSHNRPEDGNTEGKSASANKTDAEQQIPNTGHTAGKEMPGEKKEHPSEKGSVSPSDGKQAKECPSDDPSMKILQEKRTPQPEISDTVNRKKMLFQVKTLTRQKLLLTQDLLPRTRTDSLQNPMDPLNGNPATESNTEKVKPIEIFFAKLVDSWTEPLRQNIGFEQVKKQRRKVREQKVYQAYWEDESEF